MKIVILLCCLVVVALAIPTALELDLQWKQFKLEHSKTYKNAEEEQKRSEIFYNKLKKIEEHNKLYDAGLVSYRLGVNQFTDWTQEEFVSYLNKFKRPQQEYDGTFVRPLDVQIPTAIDWRNAGAVTPAKNQAQCGSCWSFSTTGAVEGQHALKTGQLLSLSEQELVDCSTRNFGCNGGFVTYAFEYIRDNGLTTEQAYPYEAVQRTCRRNGTPRAVSVTGYRSVQSGNENDLEAAAGSIGPISTSVDAINWQDYAGGLYTGSCNSTVDSLNHGVLIVGYGNDGQDHWIIKNSWDKTWGENGFIRIPRHQNKCGVSLDASYPLM